MKRIIAPSILSADFTKMNEGVATIEKSGAHLIHVDVMDGSFVPPITFGQQMVSSLKKITKLPLDVHLMVVNPSNQIDSFIDSGADLLTIHYEAEKNIEQALKKISSKGVQCGLSIKPDTPVSEIEEYLGIVDLVLVMTVNPGYGGQSMIPSSLQKVNILHEIRKKEGYNFIISIDGGVSLETLPEINKVSPDILVCGSAFFKEKNPSELVKKLATIF